MLKVERGWGHYTELLRTRFLCIKLLTFKPKSKLSMQRHFLRSEIWFGPKWFWFRRGYWHQFKNESDDVVRFIEIQYGSDVREDDIERI